MDIWSSNTFLIKMSGVLLAFKYSSISGLILEYTSSLHFVFSIKNVYLQYASPPYARSFICSIRLGNILK